MKFLGLFKNFIFFVGMKWDVLDTVQDVYVIVVFFSVL